MKLKLKKWLLGANAAPDTAAPASAGVYWGGGYPSEYALYEQDFPHAFPYANPREEEGPRYRPGPDGYWYDPAARESGRAVLCCTGDLMCEPRQHRACQYGNQYFFHPQFKFVRNILRASDLAIGNLETTLTDRTPYAGNWHRVNGKYHCSAPKCYLDALRYAGFDALVNANNHNCDSAVAGLMDTLDALDEYRFMHTGTFHPYGDPRFLLVKVNGIRMALLSYATYFNQLEGNFTELGRRKLLNIFDARRAAEDVAAARAAGAEFVLSYIHWGVEYTHDIIDSQRTYARQLADAGVDYIVGSHSHTLQPRDSVQASDGRVVPVIYSMGSFVTNEVRPICKHTGILQLTLTRSAEGIRVQEAFLPCYTFTEIRTSAYAPVPTDPLLNGGIRNETLQEADPYIRQVMSQLPPPRTAAMDADELCGILGIPRPDSVPAQTFSGLCAAKGYIRDGCLFFALFQKDEETLRSACQAGAVAVVTEQPVEDIPCLVVPDVKQAYCDVCAAIRSRFSAATALITGSLGKSTLKELLAHVLSSHGHTLASSGNRSTRASALLTLQQLREYHDFYLQEAHEGDRDSTRMLSQALLPDYAVITNIDTPHREKFDSEESFRRSFTDIAAGLKEDGILFVNGDDPALMAAVAAMERKPHRIVTFGTESEGLDFRAENVRCREGLLELDIVWAQGRVPVTVHSPMAENARHIAAAFALALSAGMAPDTIAQALSSWHSDGLCQNLMEYRGLKLLLDCRSAVPASTKAALRAFRSISPAPGGRRVAVLGDMQVSSGSSARAHGRIGRLAAAGGIDRLLCYGRDARHIYNRAIAAGFPRKHILYCQDRRALERELCALLLPGDALLIKGDGKLYLNTTVRRLFGYTVSMD